MLIRVLALAALLASPVFAQAPRADRDKALQKRVNALVADVEKITGMKLKKEVPASYQTEAELAVILRKEIEKETPQETLEAEDLTLRLLGLKSGASDLVQDMVDSTLAGMLAYYDSETKKMHVVDDTMDEDELDLTLFHELIHALQDQEHDLTKIDEALKGADHDDARLAFDFLVEGEATFWETLYEVSTNDESYADLTEKDKEELFIAGKNTTTKEILAWLGPEEGQELTPEEQKDWEELQATPPIVLRNQYDPYLRGSYMAFRLHTEKGASELRALYKDPSRLSTRDMMFPDDWQIAPRVPARVRLADLAPALGDGWKRVHEAGFESHTIHTMLEDHKREADAVARALDGCRLQTWEKDKDAFVAAVLTFATERPATTLAKQLERLYREEWTKGSKIQEHAGPTTHLSAGTDHFIVAAQGTSVFFIRGNPGVAPEKLLEALRKSEIKSGEPSRKP